jgi:hypothetical protein
MHDHYATLYTGCFFVDVQLPPGEGLFCTLAKHSLLFKNTMVINLKNRYSNTKAKGGCKHPASPALDVLKAVSVPLSNHLCGEHVYK